MEGKKGKVMPNYLKIDERTEPVLNVSFSSGIGFYGQEPVALPKEFLRGEK